MRKSGRQSPVCCQATNDPVNITVRLEEYFDDNPLSGGVTFNHYRPARYLAEQVGNLAVPAVVLDRFERVCKTVNALLRFTQ